MVLRMFRFVLLVPGRHLGFLIALLGALASVLNISYCCDKPFDVRPFEIIKPFDMFEPFDKK